MLPVSTKPNTERSQIIAAPQTVWRSAQSSWIQISRPHFHLPPRSCIPSSVSMPHGHIFQPAPGQASEHTHTPTLQFTWKMQTHMTCSFHQSKGLGAKDSNAINYSHLDINNSGSDQRCHVVSQSSSSKWRVLVGQQVSPQWRRNMLWGQASTHQAPRGAQGPKGIV